MDREDIIEIVTEIIVAVGLLVPVTAGFIYCMYGINILELL